MQLLTQVFIALLLSSACLLAQDDSAPEANTAALGKTGADKTDAEKSTPKPSGVQSTRLVLPPAARATEAWIKRLEVKTPESIALLRLLASKHTTETLEVAATVEEPYPTGSSPKTRTYTSIDFGPLAGTEELEPRPRHESEMLSIAETGPGLPYSSTLGAGEPDRGRAALREAARLRDAASPRLSDPNSEPSDRHMHSFRATRDREDSAGYARAIGDVYASSASARYRREGETREVVPADAGARRPRKRLPRETMTVGYAQAFTNPKADWPRRGGLDPRAIDRPGTRRQPEYRGSDDRASQGREAKRRIRSFRYYLLPALSRAPTVHGPHPTRFISLLAPKHDIEHTKYAQHHGSDRPTEHALREYEEKSGDRDRRLDRGRQYRKDRRSDFARTNAEIRPDNRVTFRDEDRRDTAGYARRVATTEYDRNRRRTLQNLALMPGSKLRPMRAKLPLTFGEIQRNLDDKIPPDLLVQIYRFPYTPKMRLDPYHESYGHHDEDEHKSGRTELEDADVRRVYRAELKRVYPARTDQISLEQKAQQRKKPRPIRRRRKRGCSTCP